MWRTLRFILTHPLNRSRKFGALVGYVRWQIGSRLVQGPVAVPFVENTRLLLNAGMHGGSGNLYCGLHEFESMALVMHALRPGDLFVDVGGNIGSYTVLAAGVCQASVIAIEPVLSAFDRLEENVRLNNLSSRVVTKNVALGSEGGGVPVSVGFDARNHVLGVGLPGGELTTVPLATLDSVLDGSEPTVIKIDVEGYEAAVVAGATRAFQSTSLLVVIMESNGQGYRYGFDEQALEATMIQGGFTRCSYDPYTRALSPLSAARAGEDNVLYVKNCGALSDRVRTAPRRPVHGSSL